MAAFVENAFVVERAVVEGVSEEIADGREHELSAVLAADKTGLPHLDEERGHGLPALGEVFQNPLELRKVLGMRLDRAESRFVNVSDWSLAVEEATTNALTDAALDVHGEIADVLIGHAELDRDHEHVVGGQVRFLERMDFLDLSALEHPDHLPAVIEIAREAVELPC